MTVISEGLLLNSKYIKMGREKEGFQAFLTQPSLVLSAMRFDGYPIGSLRYGDYGLRLDERCPLFVALC